VPQGSILANCQTTGNEVKLVTYVPPCDLRACSIENRSFACSGFSSALKPLPAG
jgi:predicted RNA-binding protein with PUA domain